MMRIHTKCLAVVIMLFGYCPLFVWIIVYKSDKQDKNIQVVDHITSTLRPTMKINGGQNIDKEYVYNKLPDIEYPFICNTDRAPYNVTRQVEDILCMYAYSTHQFTVSETNDLWVERTPKYFDWLRAYTRGITAIQCVPDVVHIEAMDNNKHREKRPRFLSNYKNPCWMEDGDTLTCLPYFHIFGVCRSGTTDLFRRIKMHPQIRGNKETFKKETWFWSWKRYGEYTSGQTLTLKNFTDMFNVLPKRQKYDRKTDRFYSDYITGHGDPMDIWYPYDWKRIAQNSPLSLEPMYITPHLIYHINPNIKFILLMRDPVERIQSHYLHIKLGQGRQPSMEDFDFDVSQSIKLFYKCVSEKKLRPCLYDSDLYHKMRVPVTSGFYDVFLKDWLKVFDRNQFLIIRTEDYAQNIAATLVKVFEFLELDAVDTTLLHKMSCEERTHKTVGKERMLEETKESLNSFYAGSRDNLKKLIKDYKLDLTINLIPNNSIFNNCSKLSNRHENQNSEVKRYIIHKQNKQRFIGLKPS